VPFPAESAVAKAILPLHNIIMRESLRKGGGASATAM
jgi:hypothetical protein